eukprot:gnl/TRDRNA2_/TRDRNA2_192176_c0_seq1.p1 gnl/TRDRNA2_/TRDRNA2_192176_c0~~gnl/TRDRNA2_/TRDRNA2_192176_c0_seq1.p1  ORF type:complete len:282 (+),score=44.44 gnl/TRDRNA2_/TRDRNA2_192176_c0_seq1:148-993(+)
MQQAAGAVRLSRHDLVAMARDLRPGGASLEGAASEELLSMLQEIRAGDAWSPPVETTSRQPHSEPPLSDHLDGDSDAGRVQPLGEVLRQGRDDQRVRERRELVQAHGGAMRQPPGSARGPGGPLPFERDRSRGLTDFMSESAPTKSHSRSARSANSTGIRLVHRHHHHHYHHHYFPEEGEGANLQNSATISSSTLKGTTSFGDASPQTRVALARAQASGAGEHEHAHYHHHSVEREAPHRAWRLLEEAQQTAAHGSAYRSSGGRTAQDAWRGPATQLPRLR